MTYRFFIRFLLAFLIPCSVNANEKTQLPSKAFHCVLGANIIGSIIENKRKNLTPTAIEKLIANSSLPPSHKQYLQGFSDVVENNDVARIEPFIIVNSYYSDCMR